ncbi:uncharacterized protein K441DRAFT_622702 [Cenococcum geophilum 1.58]|uniref:Uncharacterized protein n=1 Tax=Cenococcum geophilum 1.58 TaxID=794803 RepID=A0ACC8EMR0_9PEZI|nr:hypothetical protein K441DRAFT_622702 [Cenococcum geophilum 1.58]
MLWSPSSIVALLVSVMKGAIMIPIASSLGQLKWRFFSSGSDRYRKLGRFETFDNASRGVLGSISLLFALRFWHLASLGALITVLLLSMDTLIQNSISHTKDIVDHQAWVLRTNQYNTISKYPLGDGQPLPSNNVMATISGEMNWLNGTGAFSQRYYCGTGNCTFPKYQTLKAEHQCVDVTDRIIQSEGNYLHPYENEYGQPIEISVDKGVVSAMPSTLRVNNTPELQDVGPLIVSYSIIANSDPQFSSPVALECAIYWAVQTYEAKVMTTSDLNSMSLYETAVGPSFTNKSDEARTFYNQLEYISIIPDECWTNGTRSSFPENENCEFWVVSESQLALQNFFLSSVVGIYAIGSVNSTGGPEGTTFDVSSLYSHTLVSRIYQVSDPIAWMNYTVERLAWAVTASIRNNPVNLTTDEYRPAMGDNIGDVYKIRWKWLALPAGIVAATVLFLFATLLVSWKHEAWKTSALAALFHSFTENDRAYFGEADKYVEMREIGDNVEVRMAHVDGSRRIVAKL